MKLSDDFYKKALNISAIGCFIIDSRGNFLDADKNFRKFFGNLSINNLRKTNISSLVISTDIVSNFESIEKCIKSKDSQQILIFADSSLGKPIPVEFVYTYSKESGGIINGVAFKRSWRGSSNTSDIEVADKKEIIGRYVAQMGHEFRTPINGIIAMARLLMETGLSKEQIEYNLAVRQGAENLLLVLNDLLDLSKIQAGKMKIQEESFDIRNLLSNVEEVIKPRAEARMLGYHSAFDDEIESKLIGDPGRIRQIVRNLVDFSVEHTRSGDISVNYKQAFFDRKKIVLEVSIESTDFCSAMLNPNQPFDEFNSIINSWIKKANSSGLHLFISKVLVEIMHGTICAIASEKGITIRFRIPLQKQDQTSKVAPLFYEDLGAELRVLVLENQNRGALLGRDFMHIADIRCEVANSFLDASKIILKSHEEQQPFDACIIDMDATFSDDYGIMISSEEAGKRIKSNSLMDDVIIIMLTQNGMRGDIEKMKKSGFEVYLPKPLSTEALVQSISLVRKAQTQESEKTVVTRHVLKQERKKNAKILLVEDNLVNQKVALKMLEKLGYAADLAENGQEAVEKLSRVNYDLVLMDIQMPLMSGFEATRIIRDSTSQVIDHMVPVIAMTAHSNEDDRNTYLSVGMNDFIFKPIGMFELDKMVDRWITYSRSMYDLLDDTLFNREQLLDQVVGDEEKYQRLISIFIKDTTKYLEMLKELITKQNLDEALAVARLLGSVSDDVTARVMTRTARQIEQAAKTENFAQLSILILKLEEQFERTRGAIY